MNNTLLSKEKKNFLTTSICLLIVIIPDIVNFIINIISGEMTAASYVDVAEAALAKIVLVCLVAISLVSITVHVYLGLKGIFEVKNPTDGRFHIVLAKLAGFVSAFATIIVAVSMFDVAETKGDIFSVLISVSNTALLFIYAYEAKKIRAN